MWQQGIEVNRRDALMRKAEQSFPFGLGLRLRLLYDSCALPNELRRRIAFGGAERYCKKIVEAQLTLVDTSFRKSLALFLCTCKVLRIENSCGCIRQRRVIVILLDFSSCGVKKLILTPKRESVVRVVIFDRSRKQFCLDEGPLRKDCHLQFNIGQHRRTSGGRQTRDSKKRLVNSWIYIIQIFIIFFNKEHSMMTLL